MADEIRAGRLGQAHNVAEQFSQSVSFDWRLYRHDIGGSIAHARALAAAGIISSDELKKIESGLREIEAEISAGKFKWDQRLEDLHMNIEAALTERIGEPGAKLHTARSRNDQIALDLRLYVKEEISATLDRVSQLQRAALDLAERHVEVVMPGYSHLQRAQPVLFAHYLLAHMETFARDIDRLRNAFRGADVLPLGAGALAGSTIVLDRDLLARELGFAGVTQNSIDAVTDRDFVCDLLYCLAMVGLHLSRISEDFIIWSTAEFGFIEFSDEFTTTSSLMPQKKNPDMAELTRGKTGRLLGNLMAILTTLKGLPTGYNRDLQEDKEALFDSVDCVTAALDLWCAMLPQIRINSQRMQSAAGDAALLATDVAEQLVRAGVPFRQAHEIVGRLVRRAVELNTSIDQVPPPELAKISPHLAKAPLSFDVADSLAKRSGTGAPSPQNVRKQLARWRTLLG